VKEGIYDRRTRERNTGMNDERIARGERRRFAGVGERMRRAIDWGMRITWMTRRA
jgi:hypothetical protein